MHLEKSLFDLWRADHALSQLVPAERLFHELAVGEPALPYVVSKRIGATDRYTSSRRLGRVWLAFHVYAADLATARQIVAAITRRFDRRDFAVPGGAVCNMQSRGQRESLAMPERFVGAGPWRIVAEFELLTDAAVAS